MPGLKQKRIPTPRTGRGWFPDGIDRQSALDLEESDSIEDVDAESVDVLSIRTDRPIRYHSTSSVGMTNPIRINGRLSAIDAIRDQGGSRRSAVSGDRFDQ